MSIGRRLALGSRRDGECIVWRKSCRANGYGQIKVAGRNLTTHRLSYETFVGPVAPGLEVDHKCRNRACINPDHLRLATHKQNAENRAAMPGSTSGVRGVRWDAQRGQWSAAVGHKSKTVNLGRFDSLADAEQAAIEARAALFTHSQN